MSVINFLFGRPLRSSEELTERLGASAGIPVFGLDALSSAAYGPEAALALLIPLGVAGISYIVPITVCIVILLTIVYLSYRQTIEAYPQGGGSYTVAGQNLGPFAGLLAATALMILKAVPVNAKGLKDWLPLLAAPDVGTRRFALDRLSSFDTPGVAAALLAQRTHPDRGLRDQALAALAALEHGR